MGNVKSLFDLTGKIALITGGAGILGTQHALALAEAGAKVILADNNEKNAKDVSERINAQMGGSAFYVGLDVSDEQSVKDTGAWVKEKFGKLNILINNAAAKSENFFEPFEIFPLKDWKQVMGVNLDGMFLCSREFGTIMAERDGGSIINISSIYGIVAPDQKIYEGSEYMGKAINTPAIYSASKGGVVALTRYLATYWADKGIRVNCITPGGVFSGQNKTFQDRYAQRCPLGRMAKQDEFKGAIVYLASGASSYVTGHNLVVDGGWSVW